MMAGRPNRGSHVTRARAKKQERAPRVQRIARMMAEGIWFSGPSHAELAAEYGVAIETIAHDAKDASRVVRFLEGLDQDQMREHIARGLERCRQLAEEDRNPRAGVSALDAMARLLGLQSVKVDITLTQLQTLPKAELVRRIKDTLAGLQTVLASLEAPELGAPEGVPLLLQGDKDHGKGSYIDAEADEGVGGEAEDGE